MTPTRTAQLADLAEESEDHDLIARLEAWLSPEAEKERQQLLEDEWIEREAALIIKIDETPESRETPDLDKLAEDIDF